MRELKFRVWNNNTNKYEYTESDYYFVIDQRVKAYDYEQYTGLKDKNGKEIYEGDILGSNYGTVYKVSYSEPHGRFEMWSEDGCGGSITDDQYTEEFEIKVIGNIHDNPELLEGEE